MGGHSSGCRLGFGGRGLPGLPRWEAQLRVGGGPAARATRGDQAIMWPRAQESVLRGSWGAASPLDFQVCFCPLGLVGSPAPSRLTSASSRWCVPRPRGETPRLLRCSAPGLPGQYRTCDLLFLLRVNVLV